MKRLFLAAALLGLFSLVLPNLSIAGQGPAGKVQICHLNPANPEVVTFRTEYPAGTKGTMTVVLGTIIKVSVNALPAHLAHGDSQEFISWNEPGYPANTGAIIVEWVPDGTPPDPGAPSDGDDPTVGPGDPGGDPGF